MSGQYESRLDVRLQVILQQRQIIDWKSLQY